MNPEEREIHPRIAFKRLMSRFEEPQETEGFEEVVKVDFKVCPLVCESL